MSLRSLPEEQITGTKKLVVKQIHLLTTPRLRDRSMQMLKLEKAFTELRNMILPMLPL
jgi:hypothetical protein